MEFTIKYYEKENKEKPVEDFISSLDIKMRQKVFSYIVMLKEKGWLPFPYTSHIEGKIWELRIKYSSNIYRILYFMHTGRQIVLLHGFVKKTQKTPRGEIDIAIKRMNDFIGRDR